MLLLGAFLLAMIFCFDDDFSIYDVSNCDADQDWSWWYCLVKRNLRDCRDCIIGIVGTVGFMGIVRIFAIVGTRQ